MRAIVAALLMALLASASSPPSITERQAAELKLAAHYREQSKALMEEYRVWAARADDYDRNPSSHPIPKFPTWGDHCRSLSRGYLKDAKKADALALAHERMAAAH